MNVLPAFLGKAVTGLGGGCSKMYVIEGKLCFGLKVPEGEGYSGIVTPIHPLESDDFARDQVKITSEEERGGQKRMGETQ